MRYGIFEHRSGGVLLNGRQSLNERECVLCVRIAVYTSLSLDGSFIYVKIALNNYNHALIRLRII